MAKDDICWLSATALAKEIRRNSSPRSSGFNPHQPVQAGASTRYQVKIRNVAMQSRKEVFRIMIVGIRVYKARCAERDPARLGNWRS